MNKRVVVNVAVDSGGSGYVSLQKRLLDSLDAKGGRPAVMCWTNGYPPGSPDHSGSAYAFKLYAIKEAIAKGFQTVVWMDARLHAIGDLALLFEAIESSGVYVVKDDNSLASFCSDEALHYFGLTREKAKNINLACGGLLGFDFTKQIAHDIFNDWFKAYELGMYRGTVSKHSGQQEHRGDESILAALLHRHGIPYHTLNEHYCSDADVQPTTLLRSV